MRSEGERCRKEDASGKESLGQRLLWWGSVDRALLVSCAIVGDLVLWQSNSSYISMNFQKSIGIDTSSISALSIYCINIFHRSMCTVHQCQCSSRRHFVNRFSSLRGRTSRASIHNPLLSPSSSPSSPTLPYHFHSPNSPTKFFHNFTVPSSLPVAYNFPSGANPTLHTGP